MIKVKNMTSPRSGQEVANQFIISADGDVIFQSYSTVIAKKTRNGVVLDEGALDYSRTTSKYLYQFLGRNRKDIEARINEGSYTVEDLNK